MENQNVPPVFNNPQPSFFERLTNSVMLKLGVILFLVLLLLIPMALVNELITERKERELSVSHEIASKWGGRQVVSGPIIGIPYTYSYSVNTTDEKGKVKAETYVEKDYVFLASKKLRVQSTVNPEYLKRGIYQTVVYNSTVELQGEFDEIDLTKLDLRAEDLQWENAKVFVGLSDLKGLKAVPKMHFGQKEGVLQTSNGEVSLFEQTLVSDVDLSDRTTKGSFKVLLDIRGSKSLAVFPTGNETSIAVAGRWSNPSFNGGFLPEDRTVTEEDFTATWRIPSFSRKFPQQWKGAKDKLYRIVNEELTYGDYDFPTSVATTAQGVTVASMQQSTEQDMVQVNFLEAVNNYQKTTRVAKYGILVVLLTFTSLFFTEIIKKQRVHIVQYVLIGCAMVLFYSLLLAISEHLGFNWSYLISALATITLIASFIYGITKDKNVSGIFSGILAVFYAFIYFLMQLQDYSLIVGTIGVFIILAVLMKLSTKINWYQFERK